MDLLLEYLSRCRQQDASAEGYADADALSAEADELKGAASIKKRSAFEVFKKRVDLWRRRKWRKLYKRLGPKPS